MYDKRERARQILEAWNSAVRTFRRAGAADLGYDLLYEDALVFERHKILDPWKIAHGR